MSSQKQELAKAISESRDLMAKRRVKNKRDNRGRPVKNSGIYFTRHIVISDRLMAFVKHHHIANEPLGSTLERLVFAAQKKAEALVDYNDRASMDAYSYPGIIHDPDFKLVYKALDQLVEQEKQEKERYR